MYKQFEVILTVLALLLSLVFLTFVFIRISNYFTGKTPRMSLWHEEVFWISRLFKLLLAVVIPFLVASFIYFLFVISLPTATMPGYAKLIFVASLLLWALVELSLCFSISEKLVSGAWFRQAVFYAGVVLCAVGAVRLFPLILKSLAYPKTADCVMLDLPVKGTWLAGQAGATAITNGHLTNRYAIDMLRLGPGGKFFKGKAASVTDFYSFDEPVYAPADGIVTQLQDALLSDSMHIADKNNSGGNFVIIDIGDGKYVFLGHLRKGSIPVKVGERVEAGTLIGRAGNSGYSTAPHLHMHVQNKPVIEPTGRITYPFRFHRMKLTRLFFQKEVENGYLIRNDKFSN
jgi:hypothetical protein